MSLWLTRDDIVELTGYKQPSRWPRALARMNIKYVLRDADGFPMVARSQFGIERYAKRKEPNFESAA